jgi:hypothetical protein
MKHSIRVLASVAVLGGALVACSDRVQTSAVGEGTRLLAVLAQSLDTASASGLLKETGDGRPDGLVAADPPVSDPRGAGARSAGSC